MALVGFRAQNHRQQIGRRGALDKVDDRRTPRELWDELNAEFGFTLDVAASAENALTPAYLDRELDGLAQPWQGVVWCNPPYSDIRAWVVKAWAEWYSLGTPAVETIVMLLPANRTEQGWWQELIEPDRRAGRIETRFLRGRLRFNTPGHDYTKQPKGNRPPFGVVLVIWQRVSRCATEHRGGGRCTSEKGHSGACTFGWEIEPRRASNSQTRSGE